MDRNRFAPLVLRLGRRHLQPQLRTRLVQPSRSPFSSTTSYAAAPLPPSLEETARAETSTAKSAQGSHEASSLSTPNSPRQKRSLRPLIWTSTFLLIGVLVNGVFRAILFPPPLPDPDSEEDLTLVSRIKSDLNSLPVVSELRKDRSAWREYDPLDPREAMEDTSGSTLGQHLTAGTLRGSRGLAVQRSFYNSAEKREISVVFFGGGLSGWPGITHGGVLMTVIKEAMERAANGPVFTRHVAQDETRTSPAEAGPEHGTGRQACENLTLTYKQPTQANSFYIIRAEVGSAAPEKPGQISVKATLENERTGQVLITADGVCSRSGSPNAMESSPSTGQGGLWGLFGGISGIVGS